MLDSLLLLNSLIAAQKLIANARLELAGCTAVWDKAYNAGQYLNDQVAALLADNSN